VLQTIDNGKLYYCGVFHPDPDKQNVLMAGCADKKIYQFDMDTGNSMQVGLGTPGILCRCVWAIGCVVHCGSNRAPGGTGRGSREPVAAVQTPCRGRAAWVAAQQGTARHLYALVQPVLLLISGPESIACLLAAAAVPFRPLPLLTRWLPFCPIHTQEYNYHLGAVNTVTFFDEGRRFVSSSDDKTLRVWEFGIPVQVRGGGRRVWLECMRS
jgi:WD40 repeat protein